MYDGTLKAYYEVRAHFPLQNSFVKVKSDPRGRIFRFRFPLLPGFPELSTPSPPSCENFQFAICQGRVYFFWNNPLFSFTKFLLS